MNKINDHNELIIRTTTISDKKLHTIMFNKLDNHFIACNSFIIDTDCLSVYDLPRTWLKLQYTDSSPVDEVYDEIQLDNYDTRNPNANQKCFQFSTKSCNTNINMTIGTPKEIHFLPKVREFCSNITFLRLIY